MGGEAAITPLPRHAEQRTPSSPIEQLYRSIPWVLLVCIGVLGNWTPEQIQAVLTCLIPVIILGAQTAKRS
jgi:hypothetical protein